MGIFSLFFGVLSLENEHMNPLRIGTIIPFTFLSVQTYMLVRIVKFFFVSVPSLSLHRIKVKERWLGGRCNIAVGHFGRFSLFWHVSQKCDFKKTIHDYAPVKWGKKRAHNALSKDHWCLYEDDTNVTTETNIFVWNDGVGLLSLVREFRLTPAILWPKNWAWHSVWLRLLLYTVSRGIWSVAANILNYDQECAKVHLGTLFHVFF